MPRQVAAFFAAISAALVFVSPAAAASGGEALLAAMNGVRGAHGLAPLRSDARLARAARAHTADMVRRQYFAHGSVSSRLARFGVRARRVGENLAWAAGEAARARSIVELWLRSPSHRANLLHPGFRRIGLGLFAGPFGGHGNALVVTADFAG